MPLPLKYSARNLWVRRQTTLATSAGIALVVFVLAASSMLVNGVREKLLRSGNRDTAIVMQQSATAEVASTLRQGVLGLVAAALGVQRIAEGRTLATSEVVRSILVPGLDGARLVSLQVRGVSSNVAALRPNVQLVAGRRAVAGTDEAMIGAGLVGRYRGLELGGEIEMNKGRKLKVVGVFQADGAAFESEIWADLHSVQTTTQSDGYISSVTARLISAEAYAAFARALEQGSKEEGLIVERESQYYERLSQGLSGMILVLGAMVSVIFSFGAMLGAAIAMYAAVEQRTKEVGVLRALGFERRDILLTFIAESVAISLVGTAIGLGLALCTSLVEFAVGNSAAYGVELRFHFIPSSTILAFCALSGVSIGVAGGLFPALRASWIDPVRALRP